MSEKILLICESPNKIATLKSFLPSNYTIMASVGHISEIKNGGDYFNTGIEPKNNFKTNYANATTYEEMLALSVEIDAYAFTKYIMDKWFDIKIYHPEPIYDEILSRYITKYFC